jgi:Transposase DNA-binding/Transposase DDE domain
MNDPIVAEYAHVELGDQRLNRRAALIGEAMNAAPSAPLPKIARSKAELEGLYGFMENDAVDYRAILASHAKQTCSRIDEGCVGQTVLVVHDTTSFAFPGEVPRKGMGWLGPQKQGFFGHFALALAADGSHCPFGVVGLSITMRPRPVATDAPKKKRSGKECAEDPNRDSLRWKRLVDETTDLLRGHAIPIHVMDREADAYELLAGMIGRVQRFVVRVRELDRAVTTPADGFVTRSKLKVVAERAVPVVAREVALNRRRKSKFNDGNKKHPPRDARMAKLEFAAEHVRVRGAKYLIDKGIQETIDVGIVHVREIDTPPGMEPVEWLIVTTEPIGTAEEILRVVDFYRARWLIEEFFKAIKTGCAYEKRQLESAHALLIALALCVPIAWQMLLLRHQARHEPEAPARTVVSEERLEVLRAIARDPLPPSPTARDVFLAIAALGGHITRSGPPGWITLRGGMDKLLFAEEVWLAARSGSQAKDVANE